MKKSWLQIWSYALSSITMINYELLAKPKIILFLNDYYVSIHWLKKYNYKNVQHACFV